MNVHGLSSNKGEAKNPYGRPPQAAGIVEPVINHENVKQVASEKALDAALKAAAARLTVVHFYCPWFPPSHKMAVVVARLSVKYPNVQFLRLDAEALPQIAGSERYRVSGMPYFIFLKKQSIDDRMETDSEEKLEQAVLRLCGGRAVVAGAGQRLGDKKDVEAGEREKSISEKELMATRVGTNAAIDALQAMGFSQQQAVKGLAASGNDIERAAAYLLDHPEQGKGRTIRTCCLIVQSRRCCWCWWWWWQ
jgi:thiol-disulfide isomerase/thioredoxin